MFSVPSAEAEWNMLMKERIRRMDISEMKKLKDTKKNSPPVIKKKKTSEWSFIDRAVEHPEFDPNPKTMKEQKSRRDVIFRVITSFVSKILNSTEVFTKPLDYFEAGNLYFLSKKVKAEAFMAYMDRSEENVVRIFYVIDDIAFVERIAPLELLNPELRERFKDNPLEVCRWYLYIVNCLTHFNQIMTRFVNIDRMDLLEKADENDLPLHEFSYLFIESYMNYMKEHPGMSHYYAENIYGYDPETKKFKILPAEKFSGDVELPQLDMTGIEQRFYNLYKRLLSVSKYVGADTETTGLDVFDSKLVSLGLTFDTKIGFYLSFDHRNPDTAVVVVGEKGVITYLANLDRNRYNIINGVRFMNYYGSSLNNLTKEYLFYITDWLMKAKSIWHNAKYDWNIMLSATGKRLPIFMDTMLAHYVARPGYDIPQRDKRGLKIIAPNELDIPSWKIDITKCQYEVKDVAAAYNARDTCYMFAVALLLAPDLHDMWDLFMIEMNYLPVLMEAERTGIAIDTKKLADIEHNLREKADRIKAEFSAMFSPEEEFNINSGDMLKKLFYERWGVIPPRKCMQCGTRHQEPHFKCVNPSCPNFDKPDTAPMEFVTEKGSPKLDKYVLNALVVAGNQKAKDLIEYRAATKLITSYCNLPEKIHHYDSMIHPTYVQNGTATGRISSKNPNFQLTTQ